MKNLKVKLSLAAMVIGLGSAFATIKAQDPTDRKWSRDNVSGTYTDITGQQKGFDYDCDESLDVCTATYPAGQDPNQHPENSLSVENGIFN